MLRPRSAFILKFALISSLFSITGSILASQTAADFGTQDEFFFGLATAPAHVEDQLDDSWLRFAKEGGVAAWHNQIRPEDRNMFWSNPEVELDLAAETGIKVFRLGIDWARLVPNHPSDTPCPLHGTTCRRAVQDEEALKRYGEIIKMIQDRGMEVMLTLFHHSLPSWAVDIGGWTNPKVRDYFVSFSLDIIDSFKNDVDYWISFNEPSVFLGLSYIYKIWPNHVQNHKIPWIPHFTKGTGHIADAHGQVADYLKKVKPSSKIGIAKNYASYYAVFRNIFGRSFESTMSWLMNTIMLDKVVEKSDFIGLNFYSQERISFEGPVFADDLEYSESGRAVTPNAFLKAIMEVHKRYNVQFKSRTSRTQIPIIITENGVADSTDILRPAYMIEHLMVVKEAQNKGVPILGYIFWTISDNWEWADGYCPKFGLTSVDRDTMIRIPRPSYYLFSDIVKSGKISLDQRQSALKLFQDNIGTLRPVCRSVDGVNALDEPRYIPFKDVDISFDPESYKY